MHPAAKLQFERVVRKYSQWRSVPEEERSPAPAWWWQYEGFRCPMTAVQGSDPGRLGAHGMPAIRRGAARFLG
jgi:hypothetical protein